MPTFESFDGATLSYQDEGRGRAVLLLHGFAADTNINWIRSGVLDALVDEGYRVLALDARGHGLSAKPHDPAAYENDAMAHDPRALLDHLDVERAHVVGYSMGAGTALTLAATEPRVRRVVAVGVGGATLARRQSGDADGAAEEGLGSDMVDGLLADDPETITDPLARRFRTLADSVRADRQALAAYARARRAQGVVDYGSITVPVLVVAGADDELAGDPAELAARIPGATAATVPGDHFTSLQHPKLARAVLEFLA
ncbi:MAG TPA: alpha/beta hydrolase [Acidimicrobiia bacterium]|nr:alpha/beta hydrolase [Acidimicrobiia bacterium]